MASKSQRSFGDSTGKEGYQHFIPITDQDTIKQTYHSNGKLLISGEYFVLDGALALAIPTRVGQSMTVRAEESSDPLLTWQSYDVEGNGWFEASFTLPGLEIVQTQDPGIASNLQKIFQAIGRQQPKFWTAQPALYITTQLEFPRLWGLGTSSTLLVNLAQWSDTDPYTLLRESFTGSGYDIACGLSQSPILYQKGKLGQPHFVQLPYKPSFAKQLYFVYLEAKQDSRAGISRYREMVPQPDQWIDRLSKITLSMIQARDLSEFEENVRQHEQIVSQALQFPRVRERLFPDYWGQLKSLGAWGGDFVLATSDQPKEQTQNYFKQKGYPVVLSYEELLM